MKDLSGRYCTSIGRVWEVRLRSDNQYDIYSSDPKYPDTRSSPTVMSQKELENAIYHKVIELCKEDSYCKLYKLLKA